VADAFDFPGFVPAFIRPLFCEGKGPFRWAALSGDPADILATDRAILELFPENESLRRWIEMAEARVPFQGLPARICWLGYGERRRRGRFNELVRTGAVSRADRHRPRPPRLGLRGLAEPRDGGDARRLGRDRRLAAPQRPGQHRVGRELGEHPPRRRTGIGYSQHAGMVVVADGTDLAAQKLERVLTTDPGMGVIRHADAGYERAIEVARERGIRIPMLGGIDRRRRSAGRSLSRTAATLGDRPHRAPAPVAARAS
jgi:urocanate hydratase